MSNQETVRDVLNLLPKGWRMTISYDGGEWDVTVQSHLVNNNERRILKERGMYKSGAATSGWSLHNAVEQAVEKARVS